MEAKTKTYISLFSSAGVGCYGFLQEDFSCIATVELIERRLEVQKYNHKCKYDTGYICGDMTYPETKNAIFHEVNRWKRKEKIDSVDVVIATPPCQGISVTNHKKKDEISRNSLVVESIEMVEKLKPKFFVFENVMAFQKTLCITKDERIVAIEEHIKEVLGKDFVISGHIFNFMNYGSNSSRTRTLVIGVNKKYKDQITPYELFPDYCKEKTLRQIIGDFPSLNWGEICKDDFYHAFRTYDISMREWIHDLKEGESAFDNKDPLKRPHKIVDGKIVENIKKNRDKYTRQKWDRFVQCVQTRNDQLAAQNTIHPVEDRVFSIREIMEMMTIPKSFNWLDKTTDELNELEEEEKRRLYRINEINIRQCLGEAVPTIIMRQIAHKIRTFLNSKTVEPVEINNLIVLYHLEERSMLLSFIEDNPEQLPISTLMRIVELCNSKREENAAFYTNKFLINEMMNRLPEFNKDTLYILEPSVGAGGFLPFLFIKYNHIKKVVLDVVDIDADSIEILKLLLAHVVIPSNFEIHFHCSDFLVFKGKQHYDLAIGNPPYSKLKKRTPEVAISLLNNVNQTTNDLAEMFLEKCIWMSDCVALVLNKNILSSADYKETYGLLRKMSIDSVIDFGRYGFTGLSIETIALFVFPKIKPNETYVYSLKYNKIYHQKQSYIMDKSYPYILIYRDRSFDEVAEKLQLGVFDVHRDRQITKAITSPNKTENSLWVIKARNINDDGSGVTHIPGYDVFIDADKAKHLACYKYVNDNSVYLTPNMTYNPRVIENLENVIADGSVAVLTLKRKPRLTESQRLFFSTDEFRRFYQIARNLSTQSINVDNCSVYFYGVLKNDK